MIAAVMAQIGCSTRVSQQLTLWHRDCSRPPPALGATTAVIPRNSMEQPCSIVRKIVAVLKRRFSNARADQIAAAANAIIGLDDEWEEVPLGDRVPCSDQCYLAKSVEDGARIIVLKKPPDDVA
jgi:hypothetical protein